MITKDKITQIINEALISKDNNIQDKEIFITEIKVSSSNKIKVNIDSFNGIKIDDCVVLSKIIESNFDREVEDFELTVSSAGLGKPFKVFKQYKKNIGKTVKVLTIDGEKQTGKLIEVSKMAFTIEPIISKKKKKLAKIEKTITYQFKQVKEVKVVITF